MPNIRLKCNCGARLKVPDTMGGGNIRCWHCGAKLQVPRSPRGNLSPAGMVSTTLKPWIRVTCECKKVVKAPPDWIGKQGHCPRCGKSLLMIADISSSTGVDIPPAAASKAADNPHIEMFDGNQATGIPRELTAAASLENSSLIAELDLTQDQSMEMSLNSGLSGGLSAIDNDKTVSSAMKDMDATQVSLKNDLPPMPNAPPPPKPKTVGPVRAKAQIEGGFLRVQCVCGKVVKAPLDWAGTVGNCPRCGKSIVMPKVDPALAQKIQSTLAAAKPGTSSGVKTTGEARKTSAGLANPKTISSTGSRKSDASDDSGVMDSILNSENTATLAVEGVEAKEWEKRKMERAAQMVRAKEGIMGSIAFNLKHGLLGGKSGPSPGGSKGT